MQFQFFQSFKLRKNFRIIDLYRLVSNQPKIKLAGEDTNRKLSLPNMLPIQIAI
jgi:hypothetical protein